MIELYNLSSLHAKKKRRQEFQEQNFKRKEEQKSENNYALRIFKIKNFSYQKVSKYNKQMPVNSNLWKKLQLDYPFEIFTKMYTVL